MAFWPDKGRQGGDGGWRSGGKGGRGRLLSARHTLPARTISRMRVRATHRRLQHAMGAAAEVLAQDAEREQQREVCRRRRGQLIDGGARCTARVRDAGGSDTALWDVNLDPNARGPADHEHLGQSPAFSPLSPLSLSLLDAGRSRADFLFGVRVALIGRDRPSLLTYFFSEGT